MNKQQLTKIAIKLAFILFTVLFIVLTAIQIYSNFRLVGDNYLKNYAALVEHDIMSFQLTKSEAIVNGILTGLLQTAILLYIYIHVIISIIMIGFSTPADKKKSIIFNSLIGIGCIMLIPVFMWGKSIDGGIDAIGEALLYVMVNRSLIGIIAIISIVQTITYIVLRIKQRKSSSV